MHVQWSPSNSNKKSIIRGRGVFVGMLTYLVAIAKQPLIVATWQWL